MILPDHEIRKWAEAGGVYSYDPDNVNPASIDLRLGNTISVPRWYWNPITRLLSWIILKRPVQEDSPHLFWSPKRTFDRYTLWPGRFVLCHSVEATQIPTDLAAMLFSTSSTGRSGLEHLHAGWGDPGFGDKEASQWTFEFVNMAPWPVDLVAGSRLMQLVLMSMKARPVKSYAETGRYQGQMGPTPARPIVSRNRHKAKKAQDLRGLVSKQLDLGEKDSQ